MPTAIAHSLVLVFTEGVSLRQWRDTGLLEREWALYDGLLDNYEQLVLLTYGGTDDAGVLTPYLSPEKAARVRVVSNTGQVPQREFAHAAPPMVAEACRGGTAVVKTNQMAGGDVAVQVARSLRASGQTTALIARGGYLWTRFVAYEHGPHSPQADDAAAREAVVCQAADMVVGTTQDMINDLAWRYHLDPSRCRVIPNYVLAEGDPRPSTEREPGTILYAGQLVARKRVDVLIRAAAMIAGGGSKVRLDIYGDGPARRSLEALARELAAPVTFSGRIPHRDLLDRMGRCMIYAQASELEGHPKTVLEAMAAGTPVLVANSPGLMDVVTHGMNGLRLEPNADAFANAIEELLRDEEWRDTLGAAGARSIRAECGLPVVLEAERSLHRAALCHQFQHRSAA